jgi:hypothetical protein
LSAGTCREVVHLPEVKVDRHLLAAAVAELIVNPEGDAGLDCSHAGLEIVHVEFEEFAVTNLRFFDLGVVAGEVRHHTHDERQLDAPLGVVGIFVGDVHPWWAISANEPLSAIRCHGWGPRVCIRSRRVSRAQ